MVILRTRNKITDFLLILAWASPFNYYIGLKKLLISFILQLVFKFKKKQIFTLSFPCDYVTGIPEVVTPLWAMKLVDACCGIVEKYHIMSYVYMSKIHLVMPSGSAS